MFDVSSAIIQIQQQIIEMKGKDIGFMVRYAPYFSSALSFALGFGLSPIISRFEKRHRVNKIVISELKDEQASLQKEVLRYIECIEVIHNVYSEGHLKKLEIREAVKRFFYFPEKYKEDFYIQSCVKNKNSFKMLIKCYDALNNIRDDISRSMEKEKEKRIIMMGKIEFFHRKFNEKHKNDKECKEYDLALKELVINIYSYIKLGLNSIKHMRNILENKKTALESVEDIVKDNKKMFDELFDKDHDEWHRCYNTVLTKLSQ